MKNLKQANKLNSELNLFKLKLNELLRIRDRKTIVNIIVLNDPAYFRSDDKVINQILIDTAIEKIDAEIKKIEIKIDSLEY